MKRKQTTKEMARASKTCETITKVPTFKSQKERKKTMGLKRYLKQYQFG
jgi:hypothetical protein